MAAEANAHGVEQQVAGAGHVATDHDSTGVDQVGQHRQPPPEVQTGVLEHPQRRDVAVLGCGDDLVDGGVGKLAGQHVLRHAHGVGYLPLLFVALVVVMDLLLRKTQWGRHVFAVGGNEEAARRSGIHVNRIYLSVFALTGLFSAVDGLLAAGQLTSVSQASGGTDTNLTAIAAAVIGGTSLFGGRGTAYAALLGIIVLQSIQTGLNVVGVDSSVRYMVTGAVLLLAVSIDSVSRRARSSSGRG